MAARTPTHALDRHICDGCSCGGRSPVGELVPDGWYRTLAGRILCERCKERHLTAICIRNSYAGLS